MNVTVFLNGNETAFATSYRMPKIGGKYKGCEVVDIRQVYPGDEQYYVGYDCYDFYEVDVDLGMNLIKTIYICREKGTVSESILRWQNRNRAAAEKLCELIKNVNDKDTKTCIIQKFLDINF